jgi:hypothetical protein
LPSNIFVQFLAGPSDIREGGLGWLLKAVAWISLVIGPVLLLLLLQIQFLPYHLWWVTWVQRFAVLADLTLLWFLWPAVLASRLAETVKATLQKIEKDDAAKSPAQVGEAAPATAHGKRKDFATAQNSHNKIGATAIPPLP